MRGGLACPGVDLFQYKEVTYHGNGNCSKTYSKTDEQDRGCIWNRRGDRADQETSQLCVRGDGRTDQEEPRAPPTLVLQIVELLKKGSMVHIGRGDKPAGLAYVTNVVNVLLRAADSDRSVGQAYNASDGSNVTWRQYVDRLAEIVGVASPRVVIPYPVAYLVGWAMEKTYGALGTEARPLLTRTAVALFGTNQGFPVDKARRELGYEPEVNFEEGMRRTEAWLRQTGCL